MARIELIGGKSGLDGEAAELYDWIVESRGSMVRPFQVFMHSPRLAGPIARLGHEVRFESALAGDLRELAILAAGRVHGCGYVWDTHIDLARREGLRPEAVDHLEGKEAELTPREAAVVDAVFELGSSAALSEAVYRRAVEELGAEGVLELSVLAGYYTMLSYTMGAFDVCRL